MLPKILLTIILMTYLNIMDISGYFWIPPWKLIFITGHSIMGVARGRGINTTWITSKNVFYCNIKASSYNLTSFFEPHLCKIVTTGLHTHRSYSWSSRLWRPSRPVRPPLVRPSKGTWFFSYKRQ